METKETKISLPNAEAISRLFDFAREVKAALKDYPQLRLKTIFANTAAPKVKMLGHWRSRLKAGLMCFTEDHLARQVAQSRHDGTSYAFTVPSYGLRSIVMNENDTFVRQVGSTPEKTQQARAFALNHEMGHLLIQGGTARDDNHPFSENAADSFGALRHLQRFDGDTSLLKTISWNRSFMFVASGNASHLTTAALDTLVAKAATTDFSTLTTEQTRALAEKHAQEQTLPREDFDTAKKNLSMFTGRGNLYPLTQQNAWKLAALAETILATSHRFTFQIGFRVIQPFLNAQGALVNGAPVTLENDSISRYAKALTQKAKELSLTDIVQELQENKNDVTHQKPPYSTAPRPQPRAVLRIF